MAEHVLPPVPPGIDLEADQGPRIMGSMITFIVLPTIFVALRLISRKAARAGYWWDDFLVVTALILSYGLSIGIIVSEQINQFGRHLWALDDPERSTGVFLKILYICVIFYYAAVVCVKMALSLAFYRRIFPVAQLRPTLYLACFVVTAFGIGTLASAIFICKPIHGFWNRHVPSKCMSGDHILLIPGAINTVLDFFIVALPLPLLWKLRTTNSQKGILTGIFACAGFVCVISIIRLVVLSRLTEFDVTWNYVNTGIWSTAEPCMSVIAACLPSLRPLVSLIIRGTTRATETIHSKSGLGSSSMFSKRDRQGDEMDLVRSAGSGKGGFERLGDEWQMKGVPGWDIGEQGAHSPRWKHEVEVKGGRVKKTTGFPGLGTKSTEAMGMEEGVPESGIKVKSEVLVTSHQWEWKDRIF